MDAHMTCCTSIRRNAAHASAMPRAVVAGSAGTPTRPPAGRGRCGGWCRSRSRRGCWARRRPATPVRPRDDGRPAPLRLVPDAADIQSGSWVRPALAVHLGACHRAKAMPFIELSRRRRSARSHPTTAGRRTAVCGAARRCRGPGLGKPSAQTASRGAHPQRARRLRSGWTA